MARKAKVTAASLKDAESSRVKPEPRAEDMSSEQSLPWFPIVGIGASAGGLDAFSQILRGMPVDTGMAFVLIQHLDPTHASMLTDILSRATAMPVAEVTDHMTVEANRVYIIPPGTTMDIAGGILRLSPRAETRGQHRPIDHFLRALAEDQRHRAIGVILSGSATDGTLGLEAIKAEGGITFAQDDTAQHQSMPRSAVAAGCVDFVLPPAEIAQEIARISRHPYVAPGADEHGLIPAGEPSLGRVLEQLHVTTGVDFTSYKRNTLYRRITRRAVLHKFDGLKDYARFLQGNPAEVDALYQDILISVTSFFRNPDAFEVLKSKVFSRLTRDRSRHDPVRIWSLGCSTGEEAYSIAMAFVEFNETSRQQVPLQIFATDVNGVGVEKARAGVYSKTIAQDVSPERLRRFFLEIDGTYRISKSIRDMAVFARHNVLTDPPFSRIDLVSCRNLLIYLEPALQAKALGVMHYALKPHGVLWLGSSETLGSYRDLFEVEDSKQRIYSKKPGPGRVPSRSGSGDQAVRKHEDHQPRRDLGLPTPNVHREADQILLTKYTPASVLIDSDLEILQFRGETALYLAPLPGKASLNLLKMLREGLMLGVRMAIQKAKRGDQQIREEGLHVKTNGGYRKVNVQVIPIRSKTGAQQHYLVLFEETGKPAGPAKTRRRPELRKGSARGVASWRELESSERETLRLTQELAATREYLQSVIEQQEAANEELQSSNEEVQSANEELQSINEELETSKEEIQSSNEELATLNEELQTRNLELDQINNDYINLLGSAHLAIVMLGSDLRIRRFTPMAEKMLNLIAADIGRPITDIRLGVDVPDLGQMLADVMDTASVRECEVRDKQERWYVLRLRPYRTLDNRIDGVVLLLLDVDALKRSEEILRRQSEMLEQAHEAMFVWEVQGGITYWNRGAEETYGFTKEEALGQKSYELLATSPPPGVFLDALEKHGQWSGELTHVRRDGQPVVVESRMGMERDARGRPFVFETNHVVTERKRMEITLRQRADDLTVADRNKDTFLAMLAHELRNPLAPLSNALAILQAPDASPVMAERARGIMDRQLRNMARLVDDLLDVSRMTQDRIGLRKEVVELSVVIDKVLEGAQHYFDARSQAVTLSLPTEAVYVEVDVLRVEQILGNLLSNASKFTAHGGHIWLTVERDPANPTEAVVRVRDDGIGIAPTHLPIVFDLFMQADPSIDRAMGGLGIGLALVRHLVELHGGSIEAHSAGVGQGSEFVLRLPARSEGPRASLDVPRSEGMSAGVATRRIVVTDDNVDGADTLAMVLRAAGHDVRVAHDGPSTLEIATAFQPQVIFLDVGMPGQDGYETARQLRQRPAFDGTLLVALTGYGRESDRQRAREVGFDEFLVKPSPPDVVCAAALGDRRPD